MHKTIWSDPRVSILNTFFESPWYPVLLAAFVLFAHCAAVDLAGFVVVILSGLWINICCKSTLPSIANIFFIVLCVSMEHGPGYEEAAWAAYYASPVVLGLLIALGSLFVMSAIVRLFVTGDRRKILRKRTLVFGLCALCAVLLLGGIGSPLYDVDNLWLGGLNVLLLLGFYIYYSATIDYKGAETMRYFAQVCALTLGIIVLEIFWLYIRRGTLQLPKGEIDVGWGVSNVVAELVVMLLPSLFYLMQSEKHGWIFYPCVFVAMAAVGLTLSRDAMLFGVPVVLVGIVYSAFFGKNYRKVYLWATVAVCGVAVIAAIVAFARFGLWDKIVALFRRLGGTSDHGRFAIWKRYFGYFGDSWLFGAGLAADKVATGGFTVFQRLAHNTIVQILCSCGIVGMIGYLFHRATTVRIFVQYPTRRRWAWGVAIAAFLLMALFDTIFFIPYMLIYYTLMLVMSEKDYETARDAARAAREQAGPRPETDA